MVNKQSPTTEDLTSAIIKGIQEVKGHEIVTIDLRNLPNSVTDIFVICHGTSDTQVEALSKSIQKFVFDAFKEDPLHKEGMQNSEWVLLDYFNVIVHIFKESTRSFYNLEKLWADADVKEVEHYI